MSTGVPLDAPAPGPALPPEWRRYREGFVVLQHVQALTAGSARHGLHVSSIARHLGFSSEQAVHVMDYLVLQEYLRYTRAGLEVVLTPAGAEYLAAGAGQRRSVRPRFASAVDRLPHAPPSATRAPGRWRSPGGGIGGAARMALVRLHAWLVGRGPPRRGCGAGARLSTAASG